MFIHLDYRRIGVFALSCAAASGCAIGEQEIDTEIDMIKSQAGGSEEPQLPGPSSENLALTQVSTWASGYSDNQGWSSAPYYWQTIRFPDLNGDSRDDVCGRASAGLFCALSTGSSFAAPSFWSSQYSDAQGWATAPNYWQTIAFPDLNGDGRDDVCGRASDGLFCALSTGSSFAAPSFWSNQYSDAQGWSGAAYYWQTIRYPDLNGDGRDDVCGRASDGLFCALSTGSSFAAPSFWSNQYSDAQGWSGAAYYWQTIEYPDLNGDGNDDVCGRASDGLFCALSTGSSFAAPSFWSNQYSDAQGWSGAAYYWQTIEYPDLNGDGNDDVCGRASAGLYCALSNGSSFAASSFWSSQYSDAQGWSGAAYYWQTIEYPDLNGDGSDDVCGRASGGIYCSPSTGSSFAAPSYWSSDYSDPQGWSSASFYWQTIAYPDLNGDGRSDVCGRAAAGITCGLSS